MGQTSVEETRPTCSSSPTPNSLLACASSVGIHPHPHTTSRPPLRSWTRTPSGLFVAWCASADAGRFDTLRVCDLLLGKMIRKSDEDKPLPPLEILPGPPTTTRKTLQAAAEQ